MDKRNGFVVVLDMLGTKGIWSYQTPDDIINSWIEIKKYLITRVESTEYHAQVLGDSDFNISILTFSDTIIIAFPTEKEEIEYIPTIAQILGETFLFALLEHGFFFRGAISKGDYYISEEENMILGPAIDDAAEWFEVADWAGIHFSPTASYAVESLSIGEDVEILNQTAIQYNIPVIKAYKNVKEVWVWVVSWPLIYFHFYKEQDINEENKNLFKNEIFKKFSAKPINRSVQLKCRNTIDFMFSILD